jgi:hypothetical protein
LEEVAKRKNDLDEVEKKSVLGRYPGEVEFCNDVAEAKRLFG